MYNMELQPVVVKLLDWLNADAMIVKFHTCKIIYMEFQSQPASAIMKTKKTGRNPWEMLFFGVGILLLDTPFDGDLMEKNFTGKDVTIST